MKKVIENIGLWWKFEGRYYHKDFIQGVKNLIRWFPTIWKDRNWDHSFIFNILMKKLEFQSKYIGEKNRHTRAKRDAEIMMTCVRLMEKIREGKYEIEYMDYHDSDYNWIDCDTPGHKQLDIVQNKEWFDNYFKKYPLVYKKVLKENPDEEKSKIALLISIENHKRAKKVLFRLMENNVESWWE